MTDDERPTEIPGAPTIPASRSLENVERDGIDYAQYKESSRPPETIGTNPDDGLPQPMAATSVADSEAPALRPDRFVCMPDLSVFVVRDRWGQILQRHPPEEVVQLPDGSYRERAGLREIEPGVYVDGQPRSDWEDEDDENLMDEISKVEPIRPACAHYARQLVPFGGGDHLLCQRFCTALKNEHGEMLDLSNQEVLACELRSPRARDTEKQLDEFDARAMRMGAPKKEDEEFDVDAELANLGKSGGLGVLGG